MRPNRRHILNGFLSEDPIFNRDDCRYACLAGFERFRRVTGGVAAECRLSDGSRETLSAHFFVGGLLRIRFGASERGEFDGIPLDLPAPLPGFRHHRSGEVIIVEGGNLRVLFHTQSGRLQVLRGREELIGYSPETEGAWFGPITQQLGRGENAQRDPFTFFSFRLRPNERLYGGGEQFSGLDQRGRRLKGWITDTLGLNTTPLIYKWVPFFMSSRGFGLFFNSSARAVAELGNVSFTAASFKFEEPALEVFLFTGDSPREILSSYTSLTGRPPRVPAWSYGVWLSKCAYDTRAEVEATARKARRIGFPADVIHIDPRWLKNRRVYAFNATDFIWDHEAFPDPPGMFRSLHERHFRASLWINPYVWPMTGPAHRIPAMLLRDRAGDPACTPLSTEQAIYDFTAPEAREFFGGEIRKLLEWGADVLKTDYGENIPENALFRNGRSGVQMHNLYPFLYNRLVFEAVRAARGENGIVFGRSGFAGSQRFPVCWSGDSQATWDAMPQVLCGGLNAALSGIAHWSCDIGGFVGVPEPELFIRWAQWGLLISHARFHGTAHREPWTFGGRAHSIVREFAALRYRLITYLYNAGIEAARTGLPVLRPMFLEFPDDPACAALGDQYMLGPALLVRPVLEKGARRVTTYLPAGAWRDWWTGEVRRGPGYVEQRATLERIPLFQRENSVIPLNREMQYVDETHFDSFQLRAFGGGRRTFRFRSPNRGKALSAVVRPGGDVTVRA